MVGQTGSTGVQCDASAATTAAAISYEDDRKELSGTPGSRLEDIVKGNGHNK